MSIGKATTCLEDANSTDCLLQLLLQTLEDQIATDNAKFDWDPLTFAFTVPIALIAALFALVTIFQAILAAGPGRRKSRYRAIGRWADQTRMEWSWPDMTWMSIATTPLLRHGDLSAFLDEGTRTLGNTMNPQMTNRGRTDTKATGKSRREGVGGATWLDLLEVVGLGDFYLHEKGENVKHLPTTADYLPGDLLAVPAYLDVGLIVALTATAGAQSIRAIGTDSMPYPVILGDNFQFDFRQHPTLGIIGAFSYYGKDDNGLLSPTPNTNHLARTIKHAQGRMNIIQMSSGLTHGFLSDDSIEISTIDQCIPRDDTGLILKHRFHQSASACSHCPIFNREDQHHLLWLFCAATPACVPAVFPVEMSHCSHKALSLLALNSGFWSDPDVRRLAMSPQPAGSQTEDIKPCILPKTERCPEVYPFKDDDIFSEIEKKLQVQDISKVLLGQDLTGRPPVACPGKAYVFTGVLRRCWTFLYDPNGFKLWIESLDSLRKQYFRRLVLLQIQHLDYWFGNHPDLACYITALFNTTVALLDIEEMVSDCSGGNTQDRDNNNEPGRWHSFRAKLGDISISHIDTLEKVDTICSRYSEIIEDSVDSAALVKYYERDNRKGVAIPLGNVPAVKDAYGNVLRYMLGRLQTVSDRTYQIYTRILGTHQDNPKVRGFDEQQRHEEGGENHSKQHDESTQMKARRKPDELINLAARENVEDAIVWRVLLIAMLFWTAPDSSEVLKSSIWDLVIPVI